MARFTFCPDFHVYIITHHSQYKDIIAKDNKNIQMKLGKAIWQYNLDTQIVSLNNVDVSKLTIATARS